MVMSKILKYGSTFVPSRSNSYIDSYVNISSVLPCLDECLLSESFRLMRMNLLDVVCKSFIAIIPQIYRHFAHIRVILSNE